MINLKDEDIVFRLAAFEDSFVERKTASDAKDWLKTVVAFANSAPVGAPAILFIGVRNDGSIEDAVNFDSLQRTLSEKLASAYPAIYYLPKVIQNGGKQFLAVIVPGSQNRPHFAGQAFIREGSKTVVSSESQFETLVAERSSKVREISKWKGKEITFQRSTEKNMMSAVHYLEASHDGRLVGTVVDCNQFYVTAESPKTGRGLISFPLETVEINFDHANGCLELHI
jgi:hypothetical protein